MTQHTPLEPMPELVGPDALTAQEVREIEAMLERGEPLAAAGPFNALVKELESPAPLDPYLIVTKLAACSRLLARLLACDIGLPRKCRLQEHTQGVFEGHETDYLGFWPTPTLRKVGRSLALFQDIGKSLCYAVTGSRVEQEAYNLRVTTNLLKALTPETASEAERTAVRLLVGQDILGQALQGRFDHRALRELGAAWPFQLRARLNDLLLVVYLADASAHTRHRYYRHPGTLKLNPCVRRDDQTLDSLFERSEHGPVILRQAEHRQIVRALLPLLGLTDELLPTTPVLRHRRRGWFGEPAMVEGAWSAQLRLESVSRYELPDVLLDVARTYDVPISAFVYPGYGAPRSLTLVRDPNADLTMPSSKLCEQVARELGDRPGWRRSDADPSGVLVGLGLQARDGVDAPSHTPYEVLASLLRHGWEGLQTTTAYLVSARHVDGRDRWDEEEGLVINAPADRMPAITVLAARLNRRRFVVTDHEAGRTYTVERA